MSPNTYVHLEPLFLLCAFRNASCLVSFEPPIHVPCTGTPSFQPHCFRFPTRTPECSYSHYSCNAHLKRIQSGSARSHMMRTGFDAHPRNHLRRWFRCALAFDPASRVDHVGNYPRGYVMLKRGTTSANSTQRFGLVERSLLLSRSCFRRSLSQLNNKERRAQGALT